MHGFGVLRFLVLFTFAGCALEASEGVEVEKATITAVPVAQDCATVDAWLQENKAWLPTEYEDISSYPMAYRRAIFSRLAADQKSALWKQHLRRYVDSRPELSAQQLEFIRGAMDIASVKLFLEPVDLHHQALEELRKAAVDAFGEEESRLLLATLGADEVQDVAQPLATCECSVYSDWCPWWHECYFGGCGSTLSGCGTYYKYRCDGTCLYRP
ncbi:MAG TPA: bacteriocin fulvocin C-related protein [Haliangium sp.]|nr:bacteriocin fulvocin C-related protein [Haliangium sp.]